MKRDRLAMITRSVELSFFLLFSISRSVFAQDNSVSLVVRPQGFVPLRASSTLFNLGGGASLNLFLDDPSDFFLKGYARTALSYSFIPTRGQRSMNLVSVDAGVGLRLDLSSRLTLRSGVSAGGYLGLYDQLTAYNPLLSAESEVQFMLGQGFRLGLGGGYDYFVGSLGAFPAFKEKALLEGFRLFLGASFVPGASADQPRRPRMEIGPPLFQPVFPVFYQYYNTNALGTVTITNKERRAVTNVAVRFLVNQYMEAPKLGLRIEKIAPGESVEIPILALFKDSILNVTEGTTVSAQILVDYEDGKDFLSASRSDTVKIVNRNNMTWDDDRKAAAFVTANDPTVLRFARNISSAVRSESITAVNERLRIGMALFQALSIYGMEYTIDPDSSYKVLSKNDTAMDMIQFPRQTLDFRAGDCDDLSVLYGALLESVGIRSAFLTIPGHIFVAFALDMDESEARKTFSKPDDLVYIGGEAWVPVEITMVRQNFLEAWTTGAKQWRENATAKTAAHYVVRDAWQTYPPTGFSSEALGIAIPQTTEVVPNYTALLRRFVEREIAPQVSELKGRIEASNGSSRLVNRLGALYARFGLYDDAEREFLRATRFPEYLPALINLGNIAYIKKDMKNAYAYYERARSVRADDPMVLINLARVHFDLAEYDPANKRYREAEILSPEAVKEYSYIVNASKETGRASAAQTRQNVSWNEE